MSYHEDFPVLMKRALNPTDLTKVSEAAFASIKPRSGIRIQYFAVPDGMVPRNDAVIREVS